MGFAIYKTIQLYSFSPLLQLWNTGVNCLW